MCNAGVIYPPETGLILDHANDCQPKSTSYATTSWWLWRNSCVDVFLLQNNESSYSVNINGYTLKYVGNIAK